MPARIQFEMTGIPSNDSPEVKKAITEVLDWGTRQIRQMAIDTAPRGQSFSPPSGVTKKGRSWQVQPRPTEAPIWRSIKREGSFSANAAIGRVFVDTPHAKFVMMDTSSKSGVEIRKSEKRALFLPLGVSVGGGVSFYTLRNSARFQGHPANDFLLKAMQKMRIGILSKARAAVARAIGDQYKNVRINMQIRVT
jgi:hypothetical protein